MRKGITALGIGVLALAQACAEQGPESALPLSIALLSDTAQTALSSVRGLSSETQDLSYISMPPSSHPGGTHADIENQRTGQSVRTSMLDGGFDPVAIMAATDDTLEITIAFASGGQVVEYSVVPKRKRPTVVRTVPPRNKTDLPLNLQFVVVFSEPIQHASLQGGLQLFANGSPVAGSVSALDSVGTIAVLSPASPLTPATLHELRVSTDVTDLDGDRLEASLSIPFTTEPLRTAAVRIVTETFGLAPDPDGYEITIGEQAVWASPNGSALFTSVPHGEHAVRVDGVAPNCSVTPVSLTISVRQYTEALVHFQCAETHGLRVTTKTTGIDPDPDGYALRLRRTGFDETLTIPSNGTSARFGLVFGGFVLTLTGVNANCRGVGENPRTVTVADGGVLDVTYEISCATPDVLMYAMPSNLASPLAPSDIHVVSVSGSGRAQLTTDAAADADPVWSPDGARIAFRSSRDGNDEIYVMRGDGSAPTRLTTNPAPDRFPAWSPDGSRLAFVSERDGNAEIYVMNADGSNAVRVTNHGAPDESPAWSPDGTRIAFRTDRDGNGEIYVMNADGSGAQRLTIDGADDRDPAWSPDGTRIAFSRLDRCIVDGQEGFELCYADLLIMSPDGSNPTPLEPGKPHDSSQWIRGAGDLRQPTWSPDGRKLAVSVSYCGGDGDCHVALGIWILDVTLPDAVEVFGFSSDATAGRAYPFRPTWKQASTP